MRLKHIQDMLHISCNFNTSSINHSFSIGEEDTLVVKCIKETFILEVSSTEENQKVEYFTSVDQAAEAIYKKINAMH